MKKAARAIEDGNIKAESLPCEIFVFYSIRAEIYRAETRKLNEVKSRILSVLNEVKSRILSVLNEVKYRFYIGTETRN